MLVCALSFSLFFPPSFGNKFISHYRIFKSGIGYFVFIVRILAMSPFSPPPISFGNPIERTATPPKK